VLWQRTASRRWREWRSLAGAPEPTPWQHDILHGDGRPYNEQEVNFIKVTTGKDVIAAHCH